METAELSAFLIQTKGAPIHILLTMKCIQRPASSNELAEISGYSLRTLRESLKKLVRQDLIASPAQDDVWILSQKGAKLMQGLAGMFGASSEMDEPTALAPVEWKKFPPAGSSSSSSSLYTACKTVIKQQLLPKQQLQVDKKQPLPQKVLPADPKIQQAYMLLVNTGIPRQKVVKAIWTALDAQWEGNDICSAVEGWLAYAASQRGASIKHPGFFTAKRLEILEAPPEVEAESREEINRYISGKFGHLIKH